MTSITRYFGVAPAGAEESSIDQARAIFETNFFGIVRMTRTGDARLAVKERVKEVMATAEDPGVVADESRRRGQPEAALHSRCVAGRLRLLRTYAPAGLIDAGIRKDLRLDAARP